MQHVRVDHDPQRQLLQVCELRDYVWLRLTARPEASGFGNQAKGLVKESGNRNSL